MKKLRSDEVITLVRLQIFPSFPLVTPQFPDHRSITDDWGRHFLPLFHSVWVDMRRKCFPVLFGLGLRGECLLSLCKATALMPSIINTQLNKSNKTRLSFLMSHLILGCLRSKCFKWVCYIYSLPFLISWRCSERCHMLGNHSTTELYSSPIALSRPRHFLNELNTCFAIVIFLSFLNSVSLAGLKSITRTARLTLNSRSSCLNLAMHPRMTWNSLFL